MVTSLSRLFLPFLSFFFFFLAPLTEESRLMFKYWSAEARPGMCSCTGRSTFSTGISSTAAAADFIGEGAS